MHPHRCSLLGIFGVVVPFAFFGYANSAFGEGDGAAKGSVTSQSNKSYVISIFNNMPRDTNAGGPFCAVAYRVKDFSHPIKWGPWVSVPEICKNCPEGCGRCKGAPSPLLSVDCPGTTAAQVKFSSMLGPTSIVRYLPLAVRCDLVSITPRCFAELGFTRCCVLRI